MQVLSAGGHPSVLRAAGPWFGSVMGLGEEGGNTRQINTTRLLLQAPQYGSAGIPVRGAPSLRSSPISAISPLHPPGAKFCCRSREAPNFLTTTNTPYKAKPRRVTEGSPPARGDPSRGRAPTGEEKGGEGKGGEGRGGQGRPAAPSPARQALQGGPAALLPSPRAPRGRPHSPAEPSSSHSSHMAPAAPPAPGLRRRPGPHAAGGREERGGEDRGEEEEEAAVAVAGPGGGARCRPAPPRPPRGPAPHLRGFCCGTWGQGAP